MKKFFSIAVVALMSLTIANAQNLKDEIAKSQEQAAKLQALCKDYKTCGNANIDGYGNSIKEAALLSIANTEQISNLYVRDIQENADGTIDVTSKNPKLEEWVTLATTVAAEGAKIKEAVDKAKGAGEEVKNLAQSASAEKNPMKVARAARTAKVAAAVVEFGNAATPILVDESAKQVKLVDEIIKKIKAAKNM
jgi:pantoate kinase